MCINMNFSDLEIRSLFEACGQLYEKLALGMARIQGNMIGTIVQYEMEVEPRETNGQQSAKNEIPRTTRHPLFKRCTRLA